MTSVFNEIGLGRPCNLRNSPQALQSTCPVSSLLQSGVVEVLQFLQIGVDMFVLLVVDPFGEMWVVVFTFGWGGFLFSSNTDGCNTSVACPLMFSARGNCT